MRSNQRGPEYRLRSGAGALGERLRKSPETEHFGENLTLYENSPHKSKSSGDRGTIFFLGSFPEQRGRCL